MRLIGVLLIALGVVLAAVQGQQYGWDGYTAVYNQTVLTCLEKNNDAQFLVLSGIQSQKMNPDLCTTLQYAKNSGIATRDIRFTPCPTCSASATSQLKVLTDGLKDGCDDLWSHRIWLDMNTYQFWNHPWNQAGYVVNQKFFEEMVDACTATEGITCGIQSCPDQWKYIVGSTSYSYSKSLSLPLWYQSLNDVASFDDFKAFGGFTTPFAKEFSKSYVCNAEYLYENWAPAW